MPRTQPQGATGQPGLSGQNGWRGRFASTTRTSQVKDILRITVAFIVFPFLPTPIPTRAEIQKTEQNQNVVGNESGSGPCWLRLPAHQPRSFSS